MNPFTYSRPADAHSAAQEISKSPAAKFIGGGTNLIDLMKEYIEKPDRLIDLNAIHLKRVTSKPDGSLEIGALVSNADCAYHPDVKKFAPLLSDAILAGASAQLRNMATCGGNLLQRTRCYYFYDKATKCNKREPGSGCDAIKGFNRIHAVLGQSDSCIAVHPSDMCVALAALEAKVVVESSRGERVIEFADFHRLPGDTPHIDTNLNADELITALRLPANSLNRHFNYLKVRDRTSYAFALVSAAVAFELKADGTIGTARFAMGGLAHKPWRDVQAEKMLTGQKPTRELFEKVAAKVFADARGYEFNEFKIKLGQKVLVRSFMDALEKGGAS